jgi:hypothetical protein
LEGTGSIPCSPVNESRQTRDRSGRLLLILDMALQSYNNSRICDWHLKCRAMRAAPRHMRGNGQQRTAKTKRAGSSFVLAIETQIAGAKERGTPKGTRSLVERGQVQAGSLPYFRGSRERPWIMLATRETRKPQEGSDDLSKPRRAKPRRHASDAHHGIWRQ